MEMIGKVGVKKWMIRHLDRGYITTIEAENKKIALDLFLKKVQVVDNYNNQINELQNSKELKQPLFSQKNFDKVVNAIKVGNDSISLLMKATSLDKWYLVEILKNLSSQGLITQSFDGKIQKNRKKKVFSNEEYYNHLRLT